MKGLILSFIMVAFVLPLVAAFVRSSWFPIHPTRVRANSDNGFRNAFYKINDSAQDEWENNSYQHTNNNHNLNENYSQRHHSDDESPFGVDNTDGFSSEDTQQWTLVKPQELKLHDPAQLEIADSKAFEPTTIRAEHLEHSGHYPCSIMMQDCAPFIAAHAGEIVVFHLPGDLLENSQQSNSLLSDIAIAYLLGMKIVIVIGTRSDSDSCSLDFSRPHECHNALKVVDEHSLRRLEEEAGYLRTEIERKLNRCMHMQSHGHNMEGNIVSGNFYTARRYGRIRGQDFQFAGFVNEVSFLFFGPKNRPSVFVKILHTNVKKQKFSPINFMDFMTDLRVFFRFTLTT
jgi:hypothetical protein